jgi:hypothetical protein
MPTTTILDNEYATLWLHEEKKIVHHKVKKYVHGQNLQQLLMKGYEVLKKHGCKKWLSDDVNNGPLGKDDEAWAKSKWFPEVIKAGWKFWAIVMPAQLIGQLNMKRFVEDYAKAGITVSVFSESDKALAWLEGMK